MGVFSISCLRSIKWEKTGQIASPFDWYYSEVISVISQYRASGWLHRQQAFREAIHSEPAFERLVRKSSDHRKMTLSFYLRHSPLFFSTRVIDNLPSREQKQLTSCCIRKYICSILPARREQDIFQPGEDDKKNFSQARRFSPGYKHEKEGMKKKKEKNPMIGRMWRKHRHSIIFYAIFFQEQCVNNSWHWT